MPPPGPTPSVPAPGLHPDTYSLDASYSQPFETFGQVSEFVVGSDYKNYDTEYLNGTTNLGSINVNTYTPTRFAKPSPNYSTETGMQEEEYGLYSKVTFRPVERLALIAGGRFSWYRGDFYTTTLSSGSTVDDNKRVDGRFTPYGGLVYDLTENHALYASYSQVFAAVRHRQQWPGTQATPGRAV